MTGVQTCALPIYSNTSTVDDTHPTTPSTINSTLIKNRKYVANKKNGGLIPPIPDERVKWVAIGCQQCIECRKQKAREWQIRLQEDLKHNTNAKFITLTFSNESILKLKEKIDKKLSVDDDGVLTETPLS